MHSLDPLILARVQFAFTVSFHILFPAFTIGLASFLAVLEGRWLWTKREEYRELYRFWIKIFAVSFGMGVVSGVVMSYQFGLNWSRFSDAGGAILGPLLAYEVLTAFFLEAGFLGIMLFGWNKVGRGLHFFATCMVAVGTLFSAFWILSANSWMQTPAGYAIVDGRFEPADWLKIIFNPSFPYRLVHMSLAAYLSTAFAVGGVAAWHLLRGRRDPAVRRMFSMAMWMAAIVAPIQILAGDQHGLNTLEHQPVKVAAMEGDFDTRKGQPLVLFGMPDMEAQTTKWAVEIPKLGSLILTHSLDGEVKGMKAFPKQDQPYAPIVFWSFRIMVGLGCLMALLGFVSLWLRYKGELFHARWFHRSALWMGPAGFIAILAGWVTTEVGRQPWVVYGLVRTADATSPVLAPDIGFSLLLFVVTYLLVFVMGLYYMLRLVSIGPTSESWIPPEGGGNRPLAAVDEAIEAAE